MVQSAMDLEVKMMLEICHKKSFCVSLRILKASPRTVIGHNSVHKSNPWSLFCSPSLPVRHQKQERHKSQRLLHYESEPRDRFGTYLIF